MSVSDQRRTGLRLVGHKGADLIQPGNTVASFEAAVEAGVDTIEIDVLWTRDGHPRLPASERAPLLVAHDWHDAARRRPLTLAKGLDAFLAPPLDRVEVDLDVKLPGREEEIVAALRERELLDRAMVSTMELSTLARLGELEPALRRGWTYPKVRRTGPRSDGRGRRCWPPWSRCDAACRQLRRVRCPASASTRCGSTTRWSVAASPRPPPRPASS
jgi:glycerophosphoryl diester phosphodiesterase